MKIFEAVRQALAAESRKVPAVDTDPHALFPALDRCERGDARRGARDARRGPGVWRPFAGGTDLMVQLAAGTLQHRQYVNVFGSEGAALHRQRRRRRRARRLDDVHGRAAP